ncbi:hypothetical protein D3C73_1328090 [compost metagenome]
MGVSGWTYRLNRIPFLSGSCRGLRQLPPCAFSGLCGEYRFSNGPDKRIVHSLYSILLHELTAVVKAIEALLADHIKIITMVNDFINIVRGNQNGGALPGGAVKTLPNIVTKFGVYTGSRFVENYKVCGN